MIPFIAKTCGCTWPSLVGENIIGDGMVGVVL